MPTDVLVTLSIVTADTVGPGSVTVTALGRSCVTLKIAGPADTPTSILSVTGTIHVAVRWMTFSECLRSLADAVTVRSWLNTSGSGTSAVTAAFEDPPVCENPTPAARLRHTL